MDMTWLGKLAGAEGWIGLGLLALLVLLLSDPYHSLFTFCKKV